MPKRTRDYDAWLYKELADPKVAANYINAAIEDSDEMFLTALRNVAEAHKMAKVAEEAGVARESLYRTLSESGNPRLNTLLAVLDALKLRIAVEIAETTQPPMKPSPSVELGQSSFKGKEQEGEKNITSSRGGGKTAFAQFMGDKDQPPPARLALVVGRATGATPAIGIDDSFSAQQGTRQTITSISAISAARTPMARKVRPRQSYTDRIMDTLTA